MSANVGDQLLSFGPIIGVVVAAFLALVVAAVALTCRARGTWLQAAMGSLVVCMVALLGFGVWAVMDESAAQDRVAALNAELGAELGEKYGAELVKGPLDLDGNVLAADPTVNVIVGDTALTADLTFHPHTGEPFLTVDGANLARGNR